MSAKKPVEIVREIYAAFGRGDVGTILAQLAEDVKWHTRMEAVVPWSGDFSGKARVSKFFDAIFQSVDVEGFDPGEFVCEGDTVVSFGEFACKVKATGKRARTRWAFVWKVRDGKVASYEQFHDPALAAAFK